MAFKSTAPPTLRVHCDTGWTLRGSALAVGLFGASMLAAGVLPLATAYSVSEALGLKKAFRKFPRSPDFSGDFHISRRRRGGDCSPPEPASDSGFARNSGHQRTALTRHTVCGVAPGKR